VTASPGLRADDLVGARLTLDVGPVAHGGHCVARHEGRVVFVRHALPGEQVEAVVTEGGATSRFLRADAVEVLQPSVHRVGAPCPHARPGGCGGCDLQHAAVPYQRELKADVVREQLRRLGGLADDPLVDDLHVLPVGGDQDGLGWRTRVRLAVDGDGRVGLRRHRSHAVEVLDACPLLHPAVTAIGVLARTWPGAQEVAVAASTEGGQVVAVDGVVQGTGRLVESAGGRRWRVSGTGFWQVHPGAAGALLAAVRSALAPRPGEHLLDLYAGVGLFGGSLADDLGPGGRVDAVESDEGAVRDARRNLHDRPTVRLHHERVERWLASSGVRRCDLVVMDPPRSGAGREVVERLVRLAPRAVVYVACDPASLGRDVGMFRALGWRLAGLQAYDLFPMTHHVECVALLVPEGGPRELS
jgi:tRNA/tmRNA/rRNA uracil-C5-methylase (TrmA/RlmC/RlmD family)